MEEKVIKNDRVSWGNWGMRLIVIWAFLLTVIAAYNFNHNLTDKSNALRYESSIAEHNNFKVNDAYLYGAVEVLATREGCTDKLPPRPQNQELPLRP